MTTDKGKLWLLNPKKFSITHHAEVYMTCLTQTVVGKGKSNSFVAKDLIIILYRIFAMRSSQSPSESPVELIKFLVEFIVTLSSYL